MNEEINIVAELEALGILLGKIVVELKKGNELKAL